MRKSCENPREVRVDQNLLMCSINIHKLVGDEHPDIAAIETCFYRRVPGFQQAPEPSWIPWGSGDHLQQLGDKPPSSLLIATLW